MADDEELEEIRKRKYEQMMQAQTGAAAEEGRRKEIEEAKKNIIK
ncbi:MAG: DNA-binding protein, partial [Methanophagales archaeon]|nr:DNA-binding protein [Methanophagales archaeon]